MKAFASNPIGRFGQVLLLICTVPVLMGGCPQQAPRNNPPVADAGADQVVNAGAGVTLDGSGSSDPDGDALTFSWRQTLGPSVSLSGTSAAMVTFTAPTNATTLMFELTVSDGQAESVGTVTVTVQSVEETAQVIEVRQRSVLEDPAVSGDLANGWTLTRPPEAPPNPPDFDPNKGAFALLGEVQFAPLVEFELSPGATRELELQVSGPSVLLGGVRWEGTTTPLDVTMSLDGSPVATGISHSFAANRGGSSLEARTTTGGRATLSVTNTSEDTINVRTTFGALGL